MKKVTMAQVLEIINKTAKFSMTDDLEDTDLIDLGLDSIAFIQIVVRLEEEFECEIPDSKLLLTEMNTAGKIFSILEQLYNEQAI